MWEHRNSLCSNLSKSIEWQSCCQQTACEETTEIWPLLFPILLEQEDQHEHFDNWNLMRSRLCFFSILLCVSKPWLWGQRCQKGCQDYPPPESPPPAPQGKHHSIPRQDGWYNPSSSSLALPWGLLKAGHLSLIFIVFIYIIYILLELQEG